MGAIIIKFEGIEAYEESYKDVHKFLESNGLPQGIYIEYPSYPPVKVIQRHQLNDETLDQLRGLNGVIVEFNDD